MYSPHLMLDGYGCDRAKLEDFELLKAMLADFAAELGLTPLKAPYVFRYAGKTSEDWGISGLVLLEGGRLSIHSFPEKSFLSLDLFCKAPFDTETAERFIVARLGATNVEKSVLMRDRSRSGDAP